MFRHGGGMIKVLVAQTLELDDAEAAVSEILEQLDIEHSLRKYSVGLVACHADFLYEGVVAALSEKLPFDLIGMTSLGSAVNGAMGVDVLSLSVLTSDDAVFSTAMTTSLLEDQTGPVAVAYAEAASRLPEAPSFVVAYGPVLEAVGGEAFVREVDRLCGGVPVFGALTCDHNMDFRESHVFRNGVHMRDSLALVLVSGVTPTFFYISISDENIPKQKGIITSSTGNAIHTINNMPALEYFASIGLSTDHFEVSGAVPMFVDYKDGGPPIGRAVYTTKGNGDIICGGDVPENGAIAPAFLDSDEVLESATQLLNELTETGSDNGMLIVSCLSRSLVMGAEPLREAELVDSLLGNSQPYHLLYAAGEICPIYTDGGKTGNRFHNFTLTVCQF